MSYTEDQENEIGECKRDEVVVHGGVEALAAHDDDTDEKVANEPAEEDDQVEDGDEDEADPFFHAAVAKDCLEVDFFIKGEYCDCFILL